MAKIKKIECLDFTLTCSCGEEIEGAFYGDDMSETLHCDCGKVWVIPRPYHPHLLQEQGEKE